MVEEGANSGVSEENNTSASILQVKGQISKWVFLQSNEHKSKELCATPANLWPPVSFGNVASGFKGN